MNEECEFCEVPLWMCECTGRCRLCGESLDDCECHIDCDHLGGDCRQEKKARQS